MLAFSLVGWPSEAGTRAKLVTNKRHAAQSRDPLVEGGGSLLSKQSPGATCRVFEAETQIRDHSRAGMIEALKLSFKDISENLESPTEK